MDDQDLTDKRSQTPACAVALDGVAHLAAGCESVEQNAGGLLIGEQREGLKHKIWRGGLSACRCRFQERNAPFERNRAKGRAPGRVFRDHGFQGPRREPD